MDTRASRSVRVRRAAACVAALAAAPYLHGALSNRFAFDDFRFLFRNPHVTNPTSWLRPFWDATTMDPLSPTGAVRPLRTLEFALDHALFALEPTAFHLHSLLWHVVAAVLLFLLLRRLVGGLWGPFLGAVLWAVHPMQVESVAWITSRGDVATGACSFGALLLLLRSENWRDRFALCAYALGFVAMLYKEAAAILPALVFAVRLLRPRDGPPGRILPALKASIPWFAVTALYLTYRSAVMVGTWDHVVTHRLGGGTEGTFATMFRGFGAYLGLALLPVRPAIDWYLPVSTTLTDPAALGWLAAHLVLIGAAVVLRARRPAFAAGVTFFYFALVPVANWPFQLGIPTAERFLYLPLAGLALLVAAGVRAQQSRAAGASSSWVRTAVAVGVVIVCMAVISVRRTAVWQSDSTLWPQTLRSHPSPRALNYTAAEELRDGKALRLRAQAETDAAVRQALTDESTALFGSALDHALEAIEMWHLIESVERVRSHVICEPYVNASNASLQLRSPARAVVYADRAITVGEHLYPQSHYNRAYGLLGIGRPVAALQSMERARQLGMVETGPEPAAFHVRAARACRRMGCVSRALAAFRVAAETPDAGAPGEQARNGLGKLHSATDVARARAREAHLEAPDDVERRLTLATALADLGRTSDADALLSRRSWTDLAGAVRFVISRHESVGTEEALRAALALYAEMGARPDAVLGGARCAEELRLDDRARDGFMEYLALDGTGAAGRERAAASLERLTLEGHLR